MGQAYEDLGQEDAAERRYKRGIEVDPQSATSYFYLAELYRKQGKLDDAIANFEKALELDPEMTEAKLQLGVTYQTSGDSVKAQETFSELTEVRAKALPAPRPPRHTCAWATWLASRAIPIRRSSSTKRRRRPTPPRSRRTSSLPRSSEQGKAEQALTQLETAVRNNPTSAEAAFELGRAYRQQVRPKEAIKQLERAVELKPGYVEAYMQLSQAAADIENVDRAEILLNKALKLAQRDALAARVLIQRGELFRTQGSYGPAIDDFNRAISLDPRNLAAYVGLGETYRAKGEPDQAIDRYRAALLLDDTYVDAHVKLGNAYRDAGRFDEAVASYRRAAELQPQTGWIVLLVGDTLMDVGKADEALSAYQEALTAQPSYEQDSTYAGRLASVYQAQGKLDDALAAAEQAEKLATAARAEHRGAIAVAGRHPERPGALAGSDRSVYPGARYQSRTRPSHARPGAGLRSAGPEPGGRHAMAGLSTTSTKRRIRRRSSRASAQAARMAANRNRNPQLVTEPEWL